ncbi:DUF7344 domain-containing protein [Halorientalis pallida]|uniref:DUF7344 domain-containing protein n=1 Tax=Halorientalis pallida TaxID=2479928 RepID=UPI003C702A55
MNDTSTATGGGERDSNKPDLDRVFRALSHQYRRRTLLVLATANPRDEDEFSPAELRAEDDDLELFETELFHVHLPKLEAAGYVDWDRENNTITRGDNFDEIEPLIQLMQNHEDELPADWR